MQGALFIGTCVAAGGLVLLLVSRTAGEAPRRERRPPYERRPHLLSAGERAVYDALAERLAETHVVFPKVRMLDVLAVPRNAPDRFGWRGRIVQRRADFVLCDRATLTPQAIVQLDDPERGARHRTGRKRIFREACEAAGLRLLFVAPGQARDPEAVAETVATAL